MQITIDKVGSGGLYLKIMRAICGETNNKSLLDLMCHKAPYTPQLGFSENTYVDIQDRGLDFKPEKDNFICKDAISYLSESKGYWDTCICSDGIEHLSKLNGNQLIIGMKVKSKKQIIFTPLGFVDMPFENLPDKHLSGWLPNDFKGWATIVLPNFHTSLNKGAFFVWNCEDIKQDFERVKNELKSII